MMKFSIEVKEVLNRVVTVEAESYSEAQEIVEDMYYNSEIILDYSDFSGEVEFIPLL